MKKITAHIISHTHWDREWYMAYEKHHFRLVEFMDRLLNLLENDDEFKSFHLDGQTIVLEDYLQVRPENREKLTKFIKEGRIKIGPWYVLQDEFLTSSEANIRNLEFGMRDAKKFGAVSMIGYFPDSFGNIGQAPQIFKQAGMKAAVFGRGVKAVGFDNEVKDYQKYQSPFSEMLWESPDGSNILGILFANWYNNGMEIPVNKQESLAYWNEKLRKSEIFAASNQLLFMNGSDHQPVQTDLSKAINVAKSQFPDVDFVHSNFEYYVEQLGSNLNMEKLTSVRGELRSQNTEGWNTLANTASSRTYLKQMNNRAQTALEAVAEPLAVFSSMLGKDYPHHMFTYAWKTLMQNHPHDSICGCSTDEVHREMVSRFEKSLNFTEEIIDENKAFIAQKVDTACFSKYGDDTVPFIVYNTTGWERTGVVTFEIDIKRIYGKNSLSLVEELEKIDYKSWSLIDLYGKSIHYSIEDMGVCFGYDLPEDRFRQPYMAKRVKVSFLAQSLPALGYKTFALINKKLINQYDCNKSLITGKGQMENEFLKVSINYDGSLNITDKMSEHTYEGLCCYEDVGDIGNEYVFFQPENDLPISTKGVVADIKIVEDEDFRATFEITHTIEIPLSADELLTKEINQRVPFKQRKAQRSKQKVEFRIVTKVSLESGAFAVKVKTTFVNKAKDHRLRALFPTNLITETHFADSTFEVVERFNKPSSSWKNPSNCQSQHAFVSLNDGINAITIANLDLNEYEILQDSSNTIAITLLRAVGEIGDWGVFKTPEAQCIGDNTAEFEIIIHQSNDIKSEDFIEAYQYKVPWNCIQTDIHHGSIPVEKSFINWEGNALLLTGVKRNLETNDIILRWYNTTSKESCLKLKGVTNNHKVYRSNVIEERINDIISVEPNDYSITVKGAEILTLGIH